jgi:hypothetical protein
MATTDELSEIGKGITLLITPVKERNHAIVRFHEKHHDENGELMQEARSAISFANACLPFDPDREDIQFRKSAQILLVPLDSVKHYKEFGFKLTMVPLPRDQED